MASAAIGAVTSVGSAAISGKGAKKAAKAQKKAAEANRAQLQGFYNDSVARYQPTIDRGNQAANVYSGLLGLGDTATANAAYNTYLGSTNYGAAYKAAMDGVNANAYAQGIGRSGAAFKALQDRAGDVANGYLQNYLGNLNSQVQTGANGLAALTGVGQNNVTAQTAQTNNAANAASNASLSTAAAWSGALNSLGKLGTDTFGSSYKK